jgi:hypothetical protein
MISSCSAKRWPRCEPDNQEQAVRDLEIKPEEFTPADEIRKWVRELPADLKITPAALLGQQPK